MARLQSKNKNLKHVFVILGPTSSGKTSLALDLCQKLPGEIISADSRQIYTEMDIGTGKLPIENNLDIEKHKNYWKVSGKIIHGYDLVNPDEYFSAYDFAKFALKNVREILNQGKTALLVGGTGFYVDVVTGRVKPSKIKPDFNLRSELKNYSLLNLQEKLIKTSPQEFKKIDQNNPRRIIRSIEKLLSKESRIEELPYLKETKFNYIGLTTKREILYQRADLWLENIWKAGLIEETKNLMSKYHKNSKLNGLVYKSTVSFIKKEINEKEAKQKIKYDLHAYIRRQQTYFKKIPGVKWLDVDQDNLKQIVYNIVSG